MTTGKVYLIGAGPGSPELITVRGLRALREAEVVICDYLLPEVFFEELGVSTTHKKVIWVEQGKTHTSQADLHAMMVTEAKAGYIVARLKGGDPFVFGRGKEEIDCLVENGIPWEVIPGLTVGIAGPELAGTPITFRQESRSVALATAKTVGGEANEALPRADCLVFFMGVALLNGIARQLQAEGWSAETPALVIERASQPWERRVAGTLASIADLARAGHVEAPAILVVGQVVKHYRDFPERPRILYTGTDPSNFRMLGDVLHWPAIEIVPHEEGWRILPEVIEQLKGKRFDAVIFTSKVGVRSFFQALMDRGLDARLLGGRTVGVAGAGTAQQLLDYSIIADAVAAEAGSAGILASFANSGLKDLLLVQGFNAPKTLAANLEAKGFTVTRLSLHDVRPHPDLGRPLPEHDVIYFTSPSGLRAYADKYGAEAFRREVWCIGDVTFEAARKWTEKAKIVCAPGEPQRNRSAD